MRGVCTASAYHGLNETYEPDARALSQLVGPRAEHDTLAGLFTSDPGQRGQAEGVHTRPRALPLPWLPLGSALSVSDGCMSGCTFTVTVTVTAARVAVRLCTGQLLG